MFRASPAPSPFALRVVIGVGDLAVSADGAVVLSTYALGSCIGLVAFDPVAKAGGMLHYMLPNSAIAPERALKQPAMFADTGLTLLFRGLAEAGALRESLRLFIAGGASVLGGPDPFRIGERNCEVALDFLEKNGYAAPRRSVGGGINRALHLEMATGTVTVNTPLGETGTSLLG